MDKTAEQVEQEVLNAKQAEVDTDKVATTVFEKMKNFFAPVEEETKYTQAEVDKLAETKAQELAEKIANDKVAEILPNAKKAKEEELAKATAELEKKQQELELNKSLEVVDDNFKDFVKHSTKQLNISVEDFLKDNPQYQKNQTPQNTKFEASQSNGVELGEKEQQIMKTFQNTGLFNK